MQFVPGCGCCGCNPSTTKANVSWIGCGLTNLSGTATFSGPAPGSSSGAGSCSFGITQAGNYTVSVAVSGYYAGTASFSIVCGQIVSVPRITLNPSTRAITVQGCNSQPVQGATITCKDSVGATVGTCTTDSLGKCSVPVPNSFPYTVEATHPRFAGLGPVSIFGTSGGCSSTLGLGTAATGYVCLCTCGLPLPTTLHFTDTIYGSGTATYNGTSTNWEGTLVTGSVFFSMGCFFNPSLPSYIETGRVQNPSPLSLACPPSTSIVFFYNTSPVKTITFTE